jgi:hypothetical protein
LIYLCTYPLAPPIDMPHMDSNIDRPLTLDAGLHVRLQCRLLIGDAVHRYRRLAHQGAGERAQIVPYVVLWVGGWVGGWMD